jgi:outer membrane protein
MLREVLRKKTCYKLEAQAAGDQYTLINAKNQYRQNVLLLKQILQLPSTTDFKPVMPDTLLAEQAIPSLLEAQRAAVQNRPEIRYNQLQIQVAETELQKARAGYKPNISLGGAIATGYSDNQDVKYFNQVNNNLYQRVAQLYRFPFLITGQTKQM